MLVLGARGGGSFVRFGLLRGRAGQRDPGVAYTTAAVYLIRNPVTRSVYMCVRYGGRLYIYMYSFSGWV